MKVKKIMGPVLLLLLLAACSEKEKAVTELPVTPAKQEKMTEPDSEWTESGIVREKNFFKSGKGTGKSYGGRRGFRVLL